MKIAKGIGAVAATTNILFLFIISLLACTQSVQPGEEGTGIITPGQGVEGVRFGDSKETVEQKLGKPDTKGWVDGLYRGWSTYEYLIGPHAHLSIDFLDSDSVHELVDMFIIFAPYNGKTKDGIGIGTPFHKVREVYGKPQTTYSSPDSSYVQDTYCFGDKHFNIGYRDSLVTGMNMGYYVPIPEDSACCCR